MPVRIDRAIFWVTLGVGLMGASCGVGIPLGLGVNTFGPRLSVAIPCFAVFVGGVYVVAAVFTGWPLPKLSDSGNDDGAIDSEKIKERERQEDERRNRAMIQALNEDAANPPGERTQNEGFGNDS